MLFKPIRQSKDNSDRVGELRETIQQLTARVTALESSTLRYHGVWSSETLYRAGDAVTCAGSLWILMGSESRGERPGDGATSWRLAVKRGRDGRDAGSRR